MSTPLDDLARTLDGMILEHDRLLGAIIAQNTAIRAGDMRGIDQASISQEQSRVRMARLEKRRQECIKRIGLPPKTMLADVIARFPSHRDVLLEKRATLKRLTEDAAHRSRVTAKLANALLGHVNFATRLIADAVGKTGTYTRTGYGHGGRIGSIEAVG